MVLVKPVLLHKIVKLVKTLLLVWHAKPINLFIQMEDALIAMMDFTKKINSVKNVKITAISVLLWFLVIYATKITASKTLPKIPIA